MSGKQIVALMESADTNRDKVVDYVEFVKWLNSKSPNQALQHFENELSHCLVSKTNCVQAVFRVWDKDGDGLIPRTEMVRLLRKICTEFTETQIATLSLYMDQNKDGMVDYEEFVEFLFG